MATSHSANLTGKKAEISVKPSTQVKHGSIHAGKRVAQKHLTDSSISMINEEPAREKGGSSNSSLSEDIPSLRRLVAQLRQEGIDF